MDSISDSTFEKQSFELFPSLNKIKVSFKILHKKRKSADLFLALSKITSSYSLHLNDVSIDEIVTAGIRNATTLNSLMFTKCDIIINRQDVSTENNTLTDFTSTHITQPLAEGLQYSTGLESLKLSWILDCKALNILMFGLIQNKSVSSLELDHVQLDVEGGRTLRDVMRENTALRKIKITFSIDSIDVAQPLAEGLQYNAGLESLELHVKSISDSKASNTLMSALIQNKSLSSLELYEVKLDVEGGRTLRDIMRENTALRKMKISYFIDSIDVAQPLADGLQYNTGLHTLSLHHTKTRGVMKILIEGLSCNNTIQTLVLDYNSMTIEDYRLLNNSILKKNQTLNNIVIYNRGYHDHLAEELSDGLSVNIGLKNIVIHSFDLSCDDAKMLADSVMKNMNNIINIHCKNNG